MAKRRKLPNGTGSIERVKQTPQGKTRLNQYRARLPAKKGRKDIGFYKTYNEAMNALINYQEPAPAITFGQLFDKYKATNQYLKLTEKTKQRYETSFERFEELHEENIHDIKYSDLQDILDQMELEGHYKKLADGSLKRLDYSKSSIERLKHLVSKIYTIAVKNDLIKLDLSSYLEVGGVGIRRKKEVFSNEEIDKLFKSIPRNPNAMHVLNLIYTGFRTSEYLNLKKDNIDFKNKIISDFGEKTEAGRKRKMFIHPKIETVLRYLYDQSQTGYIVEYLKNDKKILPSETTFYKSIYYEALRKAGIKKKIPYTCRYTFATMAHNSGVDDKALQRLMGHTDFSITANSYIQDIDEYIYDQFSKIK